MTEYDENGWNVRPERKYCARCTATKNLKLECLKADILVAAAGVAKLIKEDWVKKNTIVIDVGINKEGDKIVGDVDFDTVKEKTKAITPVPGGVGPMTIACLLKNTLDCFKAR